MAGLRLSGFRNFGEELMSPGDTLFTPEVVALVTATGNVTITAAQILNGVVMRNGETAAVVDTADTMDDVITALAGNGLAANLVSGLSFKLRVLNLSASFQQTLNFTGWQAGLNLQTVIAAQTFRDYLLTILSPQMPVSNIGSTTSGSNLVTWYLPPGQASESQGSSPGSINILPGCAIRGTGIAANTTVQGMTAGQGGTVGLQLSQNANATATNTVLTMGPLISVSSTGSGTL